MKPDGAPHRPGLWLRTGLTLGLVLLVSSGILAYMAYEPGSVGRFRTEAGRRAYTASYRAAIEQLPAPDRSLDLPTDFGTVRVYEFSPTSARAPRNSTPLVLLPGISSGTPMWEANLPGLAETRTVYTLDALGDAGLSVQTRAIENAADQAAWLEQTLAQLELPKVHLVGHSFGGWSAANYAVHYPKRVASLALLEPVMVFQGLHWQVYVKSIPASLPFLPQSWRDAALGDFGGAEQVDLGDPVARMISDAAEHYARKLPFPGRLSGAQLRNLTMPVYVAAAANSVMHDADAVLRAAESSLQRPRLQNWPEASHSLPMEFPEQLNREVLAFAAAHDPPADGSKK